MGVSGSGKTTIAALLAQELGCEFADADWFHPDANIAKMAAGHALSDEDRWPWLDAIRTWIHERLTAGSCGVIACSALKRAYRDHLRAGFPGVDLVYLKGSRELIAARMAAREGHYMHTGMLDGQFAILEEPDADERGIVVPIDRKPVEIAHDVAVVLESDGAGRARA